MDALDAQLAALQAALKDDVKTMSSNKPKGNDKVSDLDSGWRIWALTKKFLVL